MISQTLKNIFGLSILLFILHGVEEYLTGFYAIDSHVRFVFGLLEGTSSLQVAFLVFQFMFWSALVAVYFVLLGGRWSLWLRLSRIINH